MALTDSTQVDGAQSANSDASSPVVQPSSFDPDKFAKDLEARILAKLNDPRTIQSQKDKVIAEIKKDKGLKDVWAEFKEMQSAGLSDKEIEREIRLRELEERVSGNSAAPIQSPGKAVVQAPNESVSALVSALGLDPNDPEVTNLLAGDGQLQDKVVSLAQLSARKKTVANPALVSQPAGGGTPPPPNTDALTAELVKLQKTPSQNRKRIAELEKALGWT